MGGLFFVWLAFAVLTNLVTAARRATEGFGGVGGSGGSGSAASVPFTPQGSAQAFPAGISTSGEAGWVPVAVNDKQYAGADDASYAYLTGSGSSPVVRWSVDKAGLLTSAPAAMATTTDAVYLVGLSGVTALDRASGDLLWSDSSGVEQAVAAGDVLVARMGDGTVRGYGRGSSTPRWTTEASDAASLELVANDIVLVSHGGSGVGTPYEVDRLDAATGGTVARARPGCNRSADQGTSFVVPGTSDLVFVPTSAYSCSYRWNARTGAVAWARDQDLRSTDFTRRVLFDGRYAVQPVRGGGAVVLDTETGAERTITGPGTWRLSPRWVGQGRLVASAVDVEPNVRSAAIAFDLATGAQLWARYGPSGTRSIADETDVLDADVADRLRDVPERWIIGGGSSSVRQYTLLDGLPGAVRMEDLDPATGKTLRSVDTTLGLSGEPTVRPAGESYRAAVVNVGNRLVVLPWGLGYQVGIYPPP